MFSIALIFKAYICSFFQGGKRWLLLACYCLPAAACLLACCCLPAACCCCCLLLLAAACCCLLLLAAACCCLLLACSLLAGWLAGLLAACLLLACLLLACCPGSCAWQLMNQGSFGGSFGGRSGGRSGRFICVLCLFLFLSSLSFSQTVTSSLFIVSFVHSVLLLLKSNHCGRMIVCNAKQCWQKSSLQCEGWALSCLL